MEYDNTLDDANHIDCVYRDFDNDFGDASWSDCSSCFAFLGLSVFASVATVCYDAVLVFQGEA